MHPPQEPHIVPENGTDSVSNEDSGYSSVFDAEVPSLVPRSTTSILPRLSKLEFLCERHLYTYTEKLAVRRLIEPTRDHPDRVHPVDDYVLPPDPELLSLQESLKLHLTQHHMSDIRQAVVESIVNKAKTGARISRYVIRLKIDPSELLQACSTLGNQFLAGSTRLTELLFHLVCCQILQDYLGEENVLLSEQVRIQIRVVNLPSTFDE
ncbi:hypothetical protein BGX28_009458 [Mortierella sp. GBA30]|nr:hypothetical protein BGX28_009458 [Mortierella sp. GBA30]